jgi:Na+/phosphate symporter
LTTFPAIAIFLAGLAFFFHGLDGVKESLKSMAGRSLRQRIERLTSTGALAALWGFILERSRKVPPRHRSSLLGLYRAAC